MLELVKSSLTLEAIHKIKIFGYFKEEEFKSPEKVDILKIGIRDYVSKINDTKEYEIDYVAAYPPESNFFIIEFMTTTTFLKILDNYGYAQDPFAQAELSINDEIGKGLSIVLNGIK